MTQHDVTTAAAALARARYAIALTGAGISVESGIPPFRGEGGLWTKNGEPPMDGYQRFMRDPAAGWRDMLSRRDGDDEFTRKLNEAVPNDAHFAMARLEHDGILKHTVTQNIDNLHAVAGSLLLTEIHGNRTKVRCIDCGDRRPFEDVDSSQLPPVCPRCGGMVKTDVVMFGEPIPIDALRESQAQAERADCILVVGTSAVVYPAASIPEIVLQNGGTLVEVNKDPTPYTRYAAVAIHAAAGATLPAIADAAAALI